MGKFIGCDIGGTKCAVLLADVGKSYITFLGKERFETEIGSFEPNRAPLVSAIDKLLRENKLTRGDITAIGISCGGPLHKNVIYCPPNLPGWVDVRICDILKEETGITTYLENDANACALVEWRLGAGRNTEDMVFLTMGTGMGAGIITGGRLLVGASGMGGEVGHVRLAHEGPMGYGKIGSFEGFCSGAGIAKLAAMRVRDAIGRREAPEWCPSEVQLPSLTAKVVGDAAEEGDPLAISIYKEVGAWLGRGIANIVDILNPEVVVIGSIYVRSRKLLEESMLKTLEEEAISYSLRRLRVVPASTGEALGDLASIVAALEGTKTHAPTGFQYKF